MLLAVRAKSLDSLNYLNMTVAKQQIRNCPVANNEGDKNGKKD
jgi:hypothetical protein